MAHAHGLVADGTATEADAEFFSVEGGSVKLDPDLLELDMQLPALGGRHGSQVRMPR